MVACGICCHAHAATYSENAVKAAFLHRFAAFVEWPADPEESAATFVIAVAGDDPVAAELTRLTAELTIRNRPAEIRTIRSVQELRDVRILYVGAGERGRSRALLAAAASRPILVVTDAERGLREGGVINFVRTGRNVRFEISLTAAARHGLRIRSGLLSVAARVEGAPASATPPDAASRGE